MIYLLSPLRRLWLSGLLHLIFLAMIIYLNRTPSRMFVGQQILAFDLITPTPPPPVQAPAPAPPPSSSPSTPQLVEPTQQRRVLDEILDRIEKRKQEYDRSRRRSDDLSDLRDRLKETAPTPEDYQADTTRLAPRLPQYQPVVRAPSSQAILEVGAFPFPWYLNVLQQRVYNNWKQPSSLLVIQDRLISIIHLRINRDGSITNVSIRSSSGHVEMDRSAIQAVESLGQMPPLPTAFTRNRLDINIHFEVSR
jgi:TonB family protein